MEPTIRSQPQTAPATGVVIPPSLMARMRQAKRVDPTPDPTEPKSSSPVTEQPLKRESAPTTRLSATQSDTVTPPAVERSAIPVGIRPRPNLGRSIPPLPPQLSQSQHKPNPVPAPTFDSSVDSDDWTSGAFSMGVDNGDQEELIRAGVVKGTPSVVPELDAIPSPLGVANDSQTITLLCGQDSSSFGSRKPSVPPSSYYDDWIWNALRPKDNQICVEMYVSARELVGEDKTRKSKRRDGQEVTSQYKPRNQPAFSYDHHSLIAVDKADSSPWGDAKRVMLIPFTYQEEEVKENYYATPYTEYKPKIAGAQSMLWGEDTSLHVIHGRCAISFIDDDGQEHHSEYWVVLPKDELERIHAQHFSTEQDWIEYAQDLSTKPTTYLRPNERFLGVWQGESAKLAYKTAKAQKGAVMPSDWQADEVERLNKLHYGKVKREKDRAKNATEQQAIISPLQAASDKVHELEGQPRNYEQAVRPLASSPTP